MTRKKATISEFSVGMTNIRSLCPEGKKANLKLKTITDISADIHVIVDSRLDQSGLKKWRKSHKQALSKYNIYGNYSKDRGVIILAKRSIGVTISNVVKVDEKNTVTFRMATPAGTKTDVCAVYAPSDVDSPKFFEKAVDAVNKGECPNRLIIGDFNTTMSAKLDQHQYETDPHQKCREFLTGLEYNEQFFDVFRTRFPETKSYTWRTNDGKKRARLDVALASPSLYPHIKEIRHKFHTFEATDHATILMILDFDKAEGGPGIFRCKPSLHTNPEYQTLVRDEIRLAIYDCMVSPDPLIEVGRTIISKRKSLQLEIKDLEKDPEKYADLENHKLQLALFLSCEPTIDDLIKRPLTVSKASLHEFILMRLKEVTLDYSKTL